MPRKLLLFLISWSSKCQPCILFTGLDASSIERLCCASRTSKCDPSGVCNIRFPVGLVSGIATCMAMHWILIKWSESCRKLRNEEVECTAPECHLCQRRAKYVLQTSQIMHPQAYRQTSISVWQPWRSEPGLLSDSLGKWDRWLTYAYIGPLVILVLHVVFRTHHHS